MGEFDTIANISLEIANGELSSIRNEIESELSNISVGIDASVSGPQSQRQPRDPSSGQFMSIEGVEQRVIEQTEVQVELLEDIKDELEAGGAGAGGGGALGGAGLLARLAGAGGVAGAMAFGPLAAITAGLEHLRQQQGVERGPIPEEDRPGIPEGAPGTAGTGRGRVGEPPPEPEWLPDFLNWEPPPIHVEAEGGGRANISSEEATQAALRGAFINEAGQNRLSGGGRASSLSSADIDEIISNVRNNVRDASMATAHRNDPRRDPENWDGQPVDVTVEDNRTTTVEVTTDPDRVARDVKKEVERERKKDLDDLMSRIERSLR